MLLRDRIPESVRKSARKNVDRRGRNNAKERIAAMNEFYLQYETPVTEEQIDALMAEYTALTNVYNEYINQIILGFVEPEAAIAEMNQKLYSAGLERYMAAKQDALNAWAAEKGIQ